MGLGFRADGTLWGISAKTSLFINPQAWSAQQGEEGVLEGKELGLVINEHTKEPLTFQLAWAMGADRSSTDRQRETSEGRRRVRSDEFKT